MKLIQLLALLPFFLVAAIFSFIAGMIGGRSWHVSISLEPNKGEPFVSVDTTIG